jgi:hypothetical protein
VCSVTWLPSFLVLSFVGAALLLALVARKLHDHLLVPPPPPPRGPFAILFRRKYHIKPGQFLKPAEHFDAGGQGWARLFLRLGALTLGLFIAVVYLMHSCNKLLVQFGG